MRSRSWITRSDGVKSMGAERTGHILDPMASSRRQAMLEAPVECVWQLIGDVRRHPEWWPRVEEVECDLLEEGSTYRQVTNTPGKTIETTISIERLDDSHELKVRCTETGLYASYILTPVRGGTFVDAELAVEPTGVQR